MRSHFPRLSAAALCCVLAACGWMKKEPIPKATPIKFPKEDPTEATKGKRRQVGTVLLVNSDSAFVVVDTHGGRLPPGGAALKCMRDGVESAVLAVGEERQGWHVTADIVSGTPRKGDQVFQ